MCAWRMPPPRGWAEAPCRGGSPGLEGRGVGWGSSGRSRRQQGEGHDAPGTPCAGGTASGTRAPPEPWESRGRGCGSQELYLWVAWCCRRGRRVDACLCACVWRLQGGRDPCAVAWPRPRWGLVGAFTAPAGLGLLCTRRVKFQRPRGSRMQAGGWWPRHRLARPSSWGRSHCPLWSRALVAEGGPLPGLGTGPPRLSGERRSGTARPPLRELHAGA